MASLLDRLKEKGGKKEKKDKKLRRSMELRKSDLGDDLAPPKKSKSKEEVTSHSPPVKQNSMSLLPKPERESTELPFGVYRTVQVQLWEGMQLAAKDRGGTSDPYALITLNSAKFSKSITPYRSKTVWKNLNPKWKDQKFEWHGVPSDAVLEFSFFDEDKHLVNKNKPDDSMGNCSMPLSSVTPNLESFFWRPLQPSKDKDVVSGYFRFSVRVTDPFHENPINQVMIEVHTAGSEVLAHYPTSTTDDTITREEVFESLDAHGVSLPPADDICYWSKKTKSFVPVRGKPAWTIVSTTTTIKLLFGEPKENIRTLYQQPTEHKLTMETVLASVLSFYDKKEADIYSIYIRYPPDCVPPKVEKECHNMEGSLAEAALRLSDSSLRIPDVPLPPPGPLSSEGWLPVMECGLRPQQFPHLHPFQGRVAVLLSIYLRSPSDDERRMAKRNTTESVFKRGSEYASTKTESHVAAERAATRRWADLPIPRRASEAQSLLSELIIDWVPDSRRRALYLSLSGAQKYLARQPQAYEAACDRALGRGRVLNWGEPSTSPPLKSLASSARERRVRNPPLFGGNLTLARKYLTGQGVHALKRILAVIAMEMPQLVGNTLALFPTMATLLLLFLTEDETFMVLTRLIHAAKEKTWHLFINAGRLTHFVEVFVTRILPRLPKIQKHVQKEEIDLTAILTPILRTCFLDMVPLQTGLRILDLWLLQGAKFLHRFALGILHILEHKLLDATTTEAFQAVLVEGLAHTLDPALVLRSSHLLSRQLSTVLDATKPLEAGPSEEIDNVYYIPKVTPKSSLVDDEHFEVLWYNFPARLHIKDAMGVYNSAEDGFSMTTFLEKTRDIGPNLLFVRTVQGRVFGAFVMEGWTMSNEWYGDGESFVFSILPEEKIYRTTMEDRCFQLVTKEGVQVGQALFLDETLSHGSSSACKTFGSPPLPPNFEVARIEVYRVVEVK